MKSRPGIPATILTAGRWARADRNACSDCIDRCGISVVEGVMGLFDGAAARGQSGSGTTADLASQLGWPVVLVLDVAGQTETAAAVALGCARYRDDIDIAGVILNRVASARHLALIAPAFERTKLPVFGAILPRSGDRVARKASRPGSGGEIATSTGIWSKLADVVDAAVDVDAIRRAARSAKILPPASDERSNELKQPSAAAGPAHRTGAGPSVFVHVSAFAQAMAPQPARRSFRSRHWPMRRLMQLPMRVWLPGGYPELHAGTLASANVFRAGLRTLADRVRADPRRVRRLHGAGARDRRCRRREARDDRAARA